MKLRIPRWPSLLVMALFASSACTLVLFYPPVANRSQISFSSIDCGALPPYVQTDFLQQVRRQGNFPELLDSQQSDLLGRLYKAFTSHPWVEKVSSVRLTGIQHITANVHFREPVAVCYGQSRTWTIDHKGYLLPEILPPFHAQLIPIEGMQDPPPVHPGELWPEASLVAALATAIKRERAVLGIAAIVHQKDPLQSTVLFRTVGGSQILWSNNGTTPSESADVAKLRRLREYVVEYGSLDAPDGPYHFDIRTPAEGLLRQPLGR